MKKSISIERRIQMCLLLEKMYEQEDFSKKLGLEDISQFHEKEIKKGGR